MGPIMREAGLTPKMLAWITGSLGTAYVLTQLRVPIASLFGQKPVRPRTLEPDWVTASTAARVSGIKREGSATPVPLNPIRNGLSGRDVKQALTK